jgi:hypothetical protein
MPYSRGDYRSVMSQPLVPRPAHFHRRATGAIFTPMTLVPIKPFAHPAVVAHKNVRLLLFISGINSHD